MTYWVLTVMLVFSDNPDPLMQHWQHETFESREICHKYIADNKVRLVDSIFEQFRNEEKDSLKNFEFFCENTILEEV